MRQSKTLLTIDECGSKPLKTVFSIAISRQMGDKWQSKALFADDFLSTFVDCFNVSICRLSGVRGSSKISSGRICNTLPLY